MKNAILAIIVIILLAAAGGGGYYVGRSAGLTEATNVRTEFFGQRAGNPNGAQANGTPDATQAGRGGGQFVQGGGRPTASGSVKSVQGNTITVTQQDGTTVNVTVDDKTTIQKTVNGAIADIQPGTRITVVEVTANGATTRRIQLTPGQ